jgi:RimJ/RimL family protein N-acetyltransferase
MPLHVADTQRLIIRRLGVEDAAFFFGLVNEPSWLHYIGDKGVRTVSDAERYILNGPVKMYRDVHFGLYLVALKERLEPIGICGLIKRDSLDDVDLGFAFAAKFWGKGYAYESAAAVLAHGKTDLGLRRVVAIVSPDNRASIKLLKKLGFEFERNLTLDPNRSEELELYAATV